MYEKYLFASPGGRSWVIPVKIDPSDLSYTPSQMESFEMRRFDVIDSLKEGYLILRSTDQHSYNRHEFRPNNNYYYLTGFSAPRSYLILRAESENSLTAKARINSIVGSEPNRAEISAFVDAVQSEFEKYIHIGVRIEDIEQLMR